MYIQTGMEMFTKGQTTDGRKEKMDNGPVQERVQTELLQILREGPQPVTDLRIRIKTGGIVQIATGIPKRRQIRGITPAIPGIITGQAHLQIKLQADLRPPALPKVKTITI